MDALYFRVSSDRQTAQNQFEDLLLVAEKDGSGRDWDQIRQALADCIYEEQPTGTDGTSRTVYRLHAEVAAELAEQCIYVEQGKSGIRRGRYSNGSSTMPPRADLTGSWCGGFHASAVTCGR